jgi:hypothetical protein
MVLYVAFLMLFHLSINEAKSTENSDKVHDFSLQKNGNKQFEKYKAPH